MAALGFLTPGAQTILAPLPSLKLPSALKRPSYTQLGGLVSAVSSPVKSVRSVWGEAPADKQFGAYWSQKVQLWWQQFVEFRKNKCNFLHKHKLDTIRRYHLCH